jgi:murein DD-endopeptidase MepM/ murein hydrolase activator NlpD
VGKKSFTLMIVPHSGRSTFSISIPIFVIKLLGGILASVVVFVTIFTLHVSVSYENAKADVQELSYKTKDYEQLEKQLDYFVKKTEALEKKMNELEKLDNDLRTLLKDDPALKKLEDKQGTREAPVSRGGIDRNSAIRELKKIEEKIPEQEQKLIELKHVVEERKERLDCTPSIYPVNGRITSRFGYRKSPFGRNREFHDGLDIAAPYGTNIRATADGVVTYSGYISGYGRTVTIKHGYGYVTSYCHNSKNLVKEGQKVKKGDFIAKVGSSGRSTGPHVHYMVKVNGQVQNPERFLN